MTAGQVRGGAGVTAWRQAGLALMAVVSLAAPACSIPTDAPRIETRFLIPGDSVKVPVVGQPVQVSTPIDLTDIDQDLNDRTRGGAVFIDVRNPTEATGSVTLHITAPGVDVPGTIDVQGGDGQRIDVTESEMHALLGSTVTLRAAGTVCRAAGCGTVPIPGELVTLSARVLVLLEIGGG